MCIICSRERYFRLHILQKCFVLMEIEPLRDIIATDDKGKMLLLSYLTFLDPSAGNTGSELSYISDIYSDNTVIYTST